MFEDVENVEEAANVDFENDWSDDSVDEEQPTSPVEQVDQTKAFAKRLKEETEKVRQSERENIAKSFGYESWQEYADAQTNNKLLDSGLDPESVRPVIKDLIKNDPEYIEAMKFKAEKEELEKELFATNAIQALNAKFGTNYKSVNELDKGTIDMWNNGVPLENAYAANNYAVLIENAIKKVSVKRDSGKEHMKTVTGSNEQTTTREASKGELDVVKAMGYSDEEFKKYLNRTKK